MKIQFKMTPMADREQTFGVDLPRKAPLLVPTVYLLTWRYHCIFTEGTDTHTLLGGE